MGAVPVETTLTARDSARYFAPSGEITQAGIHRRTGFINGYTIANGLSYNLVSASFVLMYAIAYGADERFAGALTGLVGMSMLMGVFSLFLLATYGAARLMGYAWATRYVFAAGLLLAPLVAAHRSFGPNGALVLIFLCLAGFSVARAIGATAWLPLIHSMTTQRNRMAFMTGNSLRFRIGATAGIVGALVFLRVAGDTPAQQGQPHVLWWILLGGVGVGCVATACLFLLPRRSAVGDHFQSLGQLRADGLRVWRRPGFRYFFFTVQLAMVAMGLFQAQRVYYLYTVLHFSPSQVASIDAVNMIGSGVLAFLLHRLAKRVGEMQVLRGTLLVMAIDGICFATLPPHPLLIGASLLIWYTGFVWFYLASDRTMLGECDAQSIQVVPVLWTSLKEFSFGCAAVMSGFVVHGVGALLPTWSFRQHYWIFDQGTMVLLCAALGLMTWSLRRHPLSAADARLETQVPAAAPPEKSAGGRGGCIAGTKDEA